MRVVLTSESFLPYLSGVTVSVDAVARGLAARGHEVLVLAPRPAVDEAPAPIGSPGPDPRYAWLPSYQLPAVAPAGYRMPWPVPWSPALRAARAFAPDVVHANSPFVSGLLSRRLSRACRAPLVFTHHTRFGDYGHYAGALSAPVAGVADAYLRRFWHGCSAIIAPSSDLAADIRARLPASHRGRVHVIPTGVDVDGIRALEAVDPRARGEWPPEAIVVAALGRLAPEKSPMTLLEGFAIAAAEDARLRLLVVGGGPSEGEVRTRSARPDVSGRVRVLGALPRPAALAHVAGCDLFVFASRTETQGLVLAEALAAGLPAIAVDGPGVRDSVRDGVDGIVVDAEPAASRPHRLAAALLDLATDGARRLAMSRAARDGADRFTLVRRIGEIEKLYGSLLAR